MENTFVTGIKNGRHQAGTLPLCIGVDICVTWVTLWVKDSYEALVEEKVVAPLSLDVLCTIWTKWNVLNFEMNLQSQALVHST